MPEAIHTSTCNLCTLTIEIGSEIWPLQNNDTNFIKNRFSWVHLMCAKKFYAEKWPVEPPECVHWARKGRCAFGDSCFFTHSDENYHNNRNNQNLLTEKNIIKSRSKGGSTAKVGVFRRFLIDQFGVSLLSSGSGVIDVAGGKGELSFELLNLNGVQCTVVDPRSLLVSQFIEKLQHGLYERNRVFGAYLQECYHENKKNPKIPSHIKLYFTQELADWVDDDMANPDQKTDQYFHDQRIRIENEVLIGESTKLQTYVKKDGKLVKISSIISDQVTPVTDPEICKVLLRNASILIGMHPDSAAEAIVDFGLRFHKPFAIVPCCVCAKSFPNRCHIGQPVRSYENFVAYLMAKDKRIQCRDLDFEGRNVVIFMDNKHF